MKRPLALDLYCGQGGSAMGYYRAGFDVVGVDLFPQPRYPFKFIQADALEFLVKHGDVFDFIHASPPCQAFSLAQRIQKNEHPDYVGSTRTEMLRLGTPYVIENVVGAPLVDPILLCGAMFPELAVYRHRLFESSEPLLAPLHPEHLARTAKMGRRVQPGEFMHVVGNFTGVAQAKVAMGIEWMNRDGLRESVPPTYTEFLGRQIFPAMQQAVAA